jgi:uncharacterized protein
MSNTVELTAGGIEADNGYGFSVVLSEQDIEQVGELLGRSPRGLEEISVRGGDGEPQVIRVASLVDDKPFPTLFWLVCPKTSYRIDNNEATGLIAQFQGQIDSDLDLQETMRVDHQKHILLREQYMSQQMLSRIRQLGYGDVFAEKGIGGISDFSRIRCLHTWYAAHLVEPNTVGRLLDAYWSGEGK